MINNFDEYCRALSSSGGENQRARLMKYLRGQMISLQKLEPGRDEEKRGVVGLTEILNAEEFFEGDELARIAETTLEALRHISANLSEKIIRENILMPTYRAKEINNTGLSWLSKRTGRTIREKLSSTKNLLAVRRRMSLDTGENRLLMAYVRQMEEYIEQKRAANAQLLTDGEREFQQIALKIMHDEATEEIGRWENMPPNNTLLSDRFYRQIWRGWTDLQKLSEQIKTDSELLGQRLCTVYFFKLPAAMSGREKFPQQPIRYDSAAFEVRPLRGLSISGEFIRVTKFATRLEIRRGDKSFSLEFRDTTLIYFEDGSELLRTELTVENLEAFIKQTADFICGSGKTLARNLQGSKVSAAAKNYMDIFATRPLYTAANGKIKRFKSRIVRQEFFSDGETFDLSAEFSAALTVDDESKIYSLASCIHASKTSNEKFNRLMQMIHENFTGTNQRVEQLSLPLPDIYNEFQLSAIRRAVRLNYNRVQTMPRSLAILFREMSRDACQKFSDGDFALVVDYVRGKISLTLVQARFDSRIKELLPETGGLIWERHPTDSRPCKPEGYANFEDKLNDFLLKNGWQTSEAAIDKILDVFGVKGLPLEAGRLAIQFSDGELWTAVNEQLAEEFQKIRFNANDIINTYLKQRAEIIGGKKVFKYIISPQIVYAGANATMRPEAEVPLLGMNFYDVLRERVEEHEAATGEELPPLWTDQLPALAIKRFYGAFELIGKSSSRKVAPQFGVTQKIPIARTFTLPKGREEYRFGLILNDSKEISYEAVVRNRAFPLAEDVECELQMTYTYGKDIPYELIFKPLKSQLFHEAKVSWESAAAQDYKNLPVPKFPADRETWQSLEHLKTRSNERNAFEWIENSFRRSVVLDLDDCFDDERNPCIFVRTAIDGKPAVVQIHKSRFDGAEPEGTWSAFIEPAKFNRREIFLNDSDWRWDRNGDRYCFKEVDGETVAFFENNFLFEETAQGYTRVTFEIFTNERTGKSRATNPLVDDAGYKFYWAGKVLRGATPYDFRKLSVMYPLHKVYFNGRSIKTPGCPEHFRRFVEKLAKTLPRDTYAERNVEEFKKLLRVMCVMAADMGQPLYDLLRVVLEKNPKLLDDDDLGCALGDYDRPEQQQLLIQIHGSTIESIQKISVLNKAAWKSDAFILNVPPLMLMPYLQSAIDFLKSRPKSKARKVLKCLEFILAMFRLRDRGDDTLNRALSLNNGKIRELYDLLEEMIDEGYELPPSRLELEIKKSTDYAQKIPDLYYALLIYINGGEDEIKISGINDTLDEDF